MNPDNPANPSHCGACRAPLTRCWELDAINPQDLRARVREQIETRLDLPRWEHAKAVEAAEIASMRDFHERLRVMVAGGAA